MSISRRYTPEHAGGDRVLVGFDFAPIVPPGVALMWDASASPTPRLEIYRNDPGNVVAVPDDFLVEPGLAPPSGGLWRWVLNPDGFTASWVLQPAGTPRPQGALALGTAVRGRQVYSLIQGGVPGLDYLLSFSVNDSLGNVWTRTVSMLVGATS